MNNLFDLTGKAAIVTGAARGLGRAFAIGLAAAGADVLASDVLDTSETVVEIKKSGRKAVGIKIDVTKKADIEKMVAAAVSEFGKVDILVNNAGIVRSAPAENMSEKDWDDVINVNLKGQFLCAQAVGKQMIAQKKGGRIVNIASVAGILGSAASASYCASKAGVILMTKTMAIEWAPHGIRVNAVCPGIFTTDMTVDFLKDPNFAQMIKTRIPMGRTGNPEELAGTVLYLASEASSYTTGHALVADGGWTVGL